MKLFKQNLDMLALTLQVSALTSMALGMIIGHVIFDELAYGLLIGVFVFIAGLVVLSTRRVGE